MWEWCQPFQCQTIHFIDTLDLKCFLQRFAFAALQKLLCPRSSGHFEQSTNFACCFICFCLSFCLFLLHPPPLPPSPLFFTHFPPLLPVRDFAHQPPPHFDSIHHVRVIRGHASSGEPPQRHRLQLRPREDQWHGTTQTHTHSVTCFFCTCNSKSLQSAASCWLYYHNWRDGDFFHS